FAVIELEIFLHLRFLFAFGRFVDWKFYETISVTHDLAHEGRVFGRDILVVEGQDIFEPHHVLVKFHPRIHLVPTDVAHAMIAIKQSCFRWIVIRFPLLEPRNENTAVILALDEKMNSVAVGINTAHDQLSVAIGQGHWFEKTLAPAAGCFFQAEVASSTVKAMALT